MGNMTWKKDSMSQCAPGRGIYDARSFPKPMGSNDVLEPETPQQNIDRRILLRVSKSPFWKCLGVLFKYIFMALLLPPYALLYGIPKWMIKKIWPFLSHVSRDNFRKVANIFTKVGHTVRNRIPTKQGMKRVLKWDKIENSCRVLRKRCRDVYVSSANWVKAIGKTCSSPLKKTVLYFKTISIKQKRDQILARLCGFSLALVRAPKAGLSLLLKKLKAVAEGLKVIWEKLSIAISERITKSRQRVNHLFKSVKARFSRLFENITQRFKVFTKASAAVETITSPLRAFFGRMQKFKQNCMTMVSTRSARLKRRWGEITKSIKLQMDSLIRRLSIPLGALKKWGQKAKAILSNAFTALKDIQKYTKRISWSTVRSKGQQIGREAWVFFQKSARKIVDLLKCLKLAKVFPRWLTATSMHYLQKAIYGGRVFLALLRIFPRYIYNIIGDLMVEFKQRLP